MATITPEQLQGIYEDVALLQSQVAELQAQMTELQLPVSFITGEVTETKEAFNGNKVYCKTINIGSLPNATNKLVATGLNMSEVNIVRVEGTARNNAGTTIPLPNTTPTTSYLIGCFVTAGGNIQIDTAIDRSEYNGVVRVYYTIIER